MTAENLRLAYAMRQDHSKVADKLKRFAGAEIGDENTQPSGLWGAFASAFTGGASFFGNKAALRALKAGEQHGVNEYREAIRDESINQDLKTVIQQELLPLQEKHLKTLEKYLH